MRSTLNASSGVSCHERIPYSSQTRPARAVLPPGGNLAGHRHLILLGGLSRLADPLRVFRFDLNVAPSGARRIRRQEARRAGGVELYGKESASTALASHPFHAGRASAGGAGELLAQHNTCPGKQEKRHDDEHPDEQRTHARPHLRSSREYINLRLLLQSHCTCPADRLAIFAAVGPLRSTGGPNMAANIAKLPDLLMSADARVFGSRETANMCCASQPSTHPRVLSILRTRHGGRDEHDEPR